MDKQLDITTYCVQDEKKTICRSERKLLSLLQDAQHVCHATGATHNMLSLSWSHEKRDHAQQNCKFTGQSQYQATYPAKQTLNIHKYGSSRKRTKMLVSFLNDANYCRENQRFDLSRDNVEGGVQRETELARTLLF